MELPALTRKIGAFTLVGVVGACFDFGTRTLLLNLGVIGFAARACSYIVGSTVAYYLNSFFTFQGDRSGAEKARAAVVYTICFLTAVVVDALMRNWGTDLPHILFWSWFVSQAGATVLNFVLQNTWVFRAHEAA